MKTTIKLISLLLASATMALAADTANATAQVDNKISVYTQPSEDAAVITILERVEDTHMAANTKAPEGWTAITLTGPHKVYILGSDTLKSGDIRVGAPYYTKPDANAPIFSQAEQGDSIEVTDLIGRWTELEIRKDVTAYIKGTVYNPDQTQITEAPTPAPAPVPGKETDDTPIITAAPPAPSPAATPEPTVAENLDWPIAAAPEPTPPDTVITATDTHIFTQPVDRRQDPASGHAVAPRSFRGTLAVSKSFFNRKPPYPFQINDDTGKRFAYLDVTHSKHRDHVEAFLERPVIVYGSLRKISGSDKEAVIDVSSIQFENFRK